MGISRSQSLEGSHQTIPSFLKEQEGEYTMLELPQQAAAQREGYILV
jgi:hypothetical protein